MPKHSRDPLETAHVARLEAAQQVSAWQLEQRELLNFFVELWKRPHLISSFAAQWQRIDAYNWQPRQVTNLLTHSADATRLWPSEPSFELRVIVQQDVQRWLELSQDFKIFDALAISQLLGALGMLGVVLPQEWAAKCQRQMAVCRQGFDVNQLCAVVRNLDLVRADMIEEGIFAVRERAKKLEFTPEQSLRLLQGTRQLGFSAGPLRVAGVVSKGPWPGLREG